MDRRCRFAILLLLFGIVGVHPKTSQEVAKSSEKSACQGSHVVDRKTVGDANRGKSGSSEKLSQDEDSNETSKLSEGSNPKIDQHSSLPVGSQKQTRKNYPHEELSRLRHEIEQARMQQRELDRERALRARAQEAARNPAMLGRQTGPPGRNRSPHRQGRK